MREENIDVVAREFEVELNNHRSMLIKTKKRLSIELRKGSSINRKKNIIP